MGKKNQFASKHVREIAEHGFPEPVGEQFVVRYVRSRGGNVMECETHDGNTILALLPAKFTKIVWAQRGDYLIVEPTCVDGNAAVGKISATIVHILFPAQVDHLRTTPSWPAAFDSPKQSGNVAAGSELRVPTNNDSAAKDGSKETDHQGDHSESEEDDDDLFQNTNRVNYDSYEDSAASEDED